MIQWLFDDDPFPDVSTALKNEDGASGLLAASTDMSPERLLDAYRHGIFPWYSEGQPVLWWSTDPRMVLLTDQFKISRSLKKRLKMVQKSMETDQRWEVRFNSAFLEVMLACAEPRKNQEGTWITEEIIQHYYTLHQQGYAHSVEVWSDGELVGGAYGICIGSMFFGESMFARVPDASKIALAWLVHFLKRNHVTMIDCQQETAHMASLGAIPISRSEFIAHLRQAVAQPPILSWNVVAPL